MQEFSLTMDSEVTGTGPFVVLVPGGLTGWISWKPHAELLSQHHRVMRVQLLAVDLGLRNAPLPPGYSANSEIEALKNALDQQSVTQADFVGWSYGAEITLSFTLHHPEYVRTLTLIEPPAIWVLRSRGPLSEKMLKEQQYIRTLATDSVTEAQLAWFSHFAGFVPESVDPRTLPQWPGWMKHRQSLRTGDAAFRHDDDIQRVRDFQKPVLLFKGEGSSEFLHQIINALGEEFPQVRTELLPGGHAPHIAAFDRFMKLLTAFWENPH